MTNLKMEYSVVSRGTEKYNNKGYIAISNIINTYRYILNADHNSKDVKIEDAYLKAKSKYNIYNIVFSRFQLITALLFSRHKQIDNNILLCGIGNLGFSCLLYLLDNNYKNITLLIRNENDNISKLIDIIYKKYNVKINLTTQIKENENYNTYIDTTGSSSILKNIFDCISFNKTIIILSTPRDENFLISPLMINRKNIRILGGHEFNGISVDERQKIYNKLLKENENKEYLKLFITKYVYSETKLKDIKNKKGNLIEMFKY